MTAVGCREGEEERVGVYRMGWDGMGGGGGGEE